MAYTIISQNNTTTTLADENGNVITVPSRSILDAGTTFTLVKINNSTATLEGSNGKIYRDIPCCVDLTQVTGFTVTKVNNNKATLEDADGITYAGVPCIVNLTESGGGSSAVIDPLNVTPSTSAQTITASGGVDGYSPVNVSAVDASIDANITAGNIKKDVSILGITGTYEGQTPTGSISITSNGTYDVTDKAEAVVNVPTTAPAHYIEKSVDANGKLINGSSIISFNGVTNISQSVLYRAYFNNTNITGLVDMSSIITLTGNGGLQATFYGCTGITGVDLSGLKSILGPNALNGTFSGCTGIVGTVDLSSLQTISNDYSCSDTFSGCTGITGVNLTALKTISGSNVCFQMFYNNRIAGTLDLSSLETISGSNACSSMFRGNKITSLDLSALKSITGSGMWGMFEGCTLLTSVDLSSLDTLSGSSAMGRCFASCTALTSLSFPAIKTTSFGSYVNQFNNMCQGIPNITLHFPSNVQSVIEGLTGYSTTAPFGATAGTVLFDLPATE